jgi:hypothetical protein
VPPPPPPPEPPVFASCDGLPGPAPPPLPPPADSIVLKIEFDPFV